MTITTMVTDIGQKVGQKIHTRVINLTHGIITTIGEPLDMMQLNKVCSDLKRYKISNTQYFVVHINLWLKLPDKKYCRNRMRAIDTVRPSYALACYPVSQLFSTAYSV